MTERPAYPSDALVVFSARLGALGAAEEQIRAESGARLEVRALGSEAELIENGRDADVVVLGAVEPMTARVLAELPRTRSVVRRGVGVDNVDLEAALEQGIPVGYVPDASVEEVSDHALACAFAVGRRINVADAFTRRGDVVGAGEQVAGTRRFGDCVLGVVGFGRIGRALTSKARTVFGTVLASDPLVAESVIAQEGAVAATLQQVWEQADVISLHAPGSPATHHLVGAAALDAMKPGVAIVNTARGDLIDEEALVAALRSGKVSACALDVTTREPLPADSPLLTLPTVLLTGHTAAKGLRSTETLRRAVADAVLAALSGRPPAYVANPGVLDRPNCRLRAPSGRVAT